MATTTTGSARVSGGCHAAGSDSGFAKSKGAGPSIHDLPWTPYGVAEPAGAVLLLLDHRSVSRTAVRRAAQVSDALDSKLQVVVEISSEKGARQPTLLPLVTDLLEMQPPRYGFDVQWTRRALIDSGREVALDISARLVVVDAEIGSRVACSVADKLELPVLVARAARRDGELIAASAMRHPGLPVLSTAREYARVFGRDLICVHNATPMPIYASDPTAAPTSYVSGLAMQDGVAAAKRRRLSRFSARDRTVDSLVTRDGSTLDAVLGLARDRDADLIVVGHQRRAWISRLFGRGTTERIVEHSQRSVLIVPIHRG